MKLGLIADDNTGATDAAGMLTERGLRTVLALDADCGAPPAALGDFDAFVVGTQNRSIAPAAAAQATRRAIEMLKAWGADRYQIKYCSTFDSTREGNIGPTLDAALEALEATATIVCPALPVNRRTVYQGHLFVGSQLLSESPLRNHPLNPMTDANLVRWLGYQTSRKVGLLDLTAVRLGIEAIGRHLDARLAEGCSYIVTDAISEEDLLLIARATRDWPLASGGSGITAALAAVHDLSARDQEGWPLWSDGSPASSDGGPRRSSLRFDRELAALGTGTLVVSGSQSPATRRQTEHALSQGWTGLRLDVAAVLRGTWDPDALMAQAERELTRRQPVILYSLSDREGQASCDLALGRTLGLSDVETGNRIADALAELAQRLVQRRLVQRLVVSGGETSGTVCGRLGLQTLEVGLPICPGVPYCFTWPDRRLLLVLKSGNFGTEDLYQRVRELA
jgi:3-dehydrotetronate 4-kinase